MLTQQQKNHRRKRASPKQLVFLRKKFLENPKPDQSTRELIGRQIDMTPRSVQIWFQNNRAKSKVRDRRFNSICSLPLTTSSCGDKISRVHVDVSALEKGGRLYDNSDLSFYTPSLPSSMNSRVGCASQCSTSKSLFKGLHEGQLDTGSIALDLDAIDNSELDFVFESELSSTVSEPICPSGTSFSNMDIAVDTPSHSPLALEQLEIDSNKHNFFYNQDFTTSSPHIPIKGYGIDRNSLSPGGHMELEWFKFDIWGLTVNKWQMPEHINSAYLLYSPQQQKIRTVINDTVGFDCEIEDVQVLSNNNMFVKFFGKPQFWEINREIMRPTNSDFTNGEISKTDALALFGHFDNFVTLYNKTKNFNGSLYPEEEIYDDRNSQFYPRGFHKSKCSDHRLSLLMATLP